MMPPKDYRIEIKVKNNCLLEMMDKRGIQSQSELARLAGMRPSSVGYIANMSRPAINKAGGWFLHVRKMADYLQCLPEDLFPPQHVHQELQKRTASIKASEEDLRQFQGMLEADVDAANNPIALLEMREMAEIARTVIDDLPKRERDVFLRRAESGDTLDEIADDYRVTRERIRQLECRARRKVLGRMAMIDRDGWPEGLERRQG